MPSRDRYHQWRLGLILGDGENHRGTVPVHMHASAYGALGDAVEAAGAFHESAAQWRRHPGSGEGVGPLNPSRVAAG